MTRQVIREAVTGANVGAVLGYYIVFAFRLMDSSDQVYAFEPRPGNFSYLANNVRINVCSNVTHSEQCSRRPCGSRVSAGIKLTGRDQTAHDAANEIYGRRDEIKKRTSNHPQRLLRPALMAANLCDQA